VRRISDLSFNRKELNQLVSIGALNGNEGIEHRRDALWQTQQVTRAARPLLNAACNAVARSPLQKLLTEDRLLADYAGTGPGRRAASMTYRRSELRERVFSQQRSCLHLQKVEWSPQPDAL